LSLRGAARRALPYLIAATGGFLIAYMLVAFFLFPADIIPDDAVVPNVVNTSFDDATRTLARVGFKSQRGESRFHPSAPGRTVLQQEPPAGTREKTGTMITLHISSGQRSATVPSVIGNTRQQAQIAIENAGLEMGRLDMQNSDKPAGTVITVRPQPGEKVNLPARVDLVVSRGPATSEIPNLIGQSLPQARARLQIMGLQVGAVEIDTTSIEVANTVTAQDPLPGQTVLSGAMVKLIISGRRR
jgi:serine/threonine-protein kinase